MSPRARIQVAGIVLFLAARELRAAETVECILVKVNDEVITLSEYQRQKKTVLDDIYRQKLTDEDTRKQLDEARDRLLPSLIEEKLLMQQARDLGLSTPKDEVDRIVNSIMEQNKILDEASLERELKREGMSLTDLRANIERRSLIEKVKQFEVASKIVVTDEEARRYYDAHKDDFRQPERVRLREIVLLTEKRPEDQVRKEIEEIAALIKNGADFAELATLFSQAPTAENGGDLGLLKTSDLTPDISAEALKLEPGQVSQPIPTKYGLHLLKLVERKQVSYRTFEEARDDIIRRVQESRYGEKVDAYLADLKKGAFVLTIEECQAKAQ
jgi:peptidyl-prolyl cis-trans isomerase SurA